MSDSVYERAINIQDHLGVTLKLVQEPDDLLGSKLKGMEKSVNNTLTNFYNKANAD